MPRERSLSPSNSLAIAPEAAAALPAVPNAAAVPDGPPPASSNNNAPADLRPEPPQAGPNPPRPQQGGCVSLAGHRTRAGARLRAAHTVCTAHAALPVCAVGVLSGARRERVALHIKNLSIRTTERELAEYFRAAGKVREPDGPAQRHPSPPR